MYSFVLLEGSAHASDHVLASCDWVMGKRFEGYLRLRFWFFANAIISTISLAVAVFKLDRRLNKDMEQRVDASLKQTILHLLFRWWSCECA